jgi:dienelactone hydrolase
MLRRHLFAAALFCALALTASSPAVRAAGDANAAFKAFWDAPNAVAAEKTVGGIIDSGADFDAVATRLKAGRPYAMEKTGLIRRPAPVGGVSMESLIEIPAEYDPAKKWELRVQLHGGVGREPQAGRQPQSTRIPGESQIYIEPQASEDAAWWHTSQVDNILNLLDTVKRKYNVDETRTYITGISDGGTGTYFFAMREPNPWSACLTLNGQPLVLSNRDARIEGNLYLGNLANCPLYIENGDHDPLYPADGVAPIVDAMRRAGVKPLFTVEENSKHDTHWWPEERATYEKFVHDHPRQAHPDRLSWETDRTDRFNRLRWLVVDTLGVRKTDQALEDVNVFNATPELKMNVFPRRRQVPTGRIDIERHGNAFEAKTRGVRDFTLLLSPDAVDFARPVQVTVNGAPAFAGVVKKDVATLLKWAARDNDRTTLYGAELHVTVPN